MNVAPSRCPRVVLATVLASLTMLCSAAAEAVPPGFDVATEKVREILREDGGDSGWGADPPAEEIAARGEPFAATALSGAGHAMLLIGADGRPMGSHLRLLHVSVEGDRTSASDCVLRLGRDEDRSCPPAPLALVDCATWSVPAEAVRTATLAARAALFVRVYEKKLIAGPREERDDGGPLYGGASGGFASSSVEALARRTGRDTRCDGGRRLADDAAAAAWAARSE